MALIFVIAAGVWMITRYGNHATYLCLACHAEFRPKRGAFIFSGHTPTTRKLTCPCCHEKDWCVERYHAEPLDIEPGECALGTRKTDACRAQGDANAEGGDAR